VTEIRDLWEILALQAVPVPKAFLAISETLDLMDPRATRVRKVTLAPQQLSR
jgi:hypothetical protein